MPCLKKFKVLDKIYIQEHQFSDDHFKMKKEMDFRPYVLFILFNGLLFIWSMLKDNMEKSVYRLSFFIDRNISYFVVESNKDRLYVREQWERSFTA